MVKLRVISFRKIKLNIKRFIVISFAILIILSIINGIKIIRDGKEEYIKEEKEKNLNDKQIDSDSIREIIGKRLLKDSFVFFVEDYNKLSTFDDKDEIDILKDNLGIISVINNSIDDNVSFNIKASDENIINSSFVYVKENEDENKDKNNNDNEYGNNDKNENVKSNVNNFDNTYSLPIENSNDILDVDIKNISKKCETRVLEIKNKVDKYNVVVGNVKIRNESKYTINESVLGFDLKIDNKKDVVIYHTHTCESYTASDKYNYVQTGNYRSTDLSYSVSRVGDVLEVYLNRLGYSVNHNKTYHDYPAYNGSYNRALKTIENTLKEKSAQIIIDLHRDAIGNSSDYGPTIEIGGEKVAQIMFVIGTDGGGLKHNNWKENLKFAIELQSKAEEMYPGFIKPIIVRNARYNQHVGKGAIIVEVGATGNTLEEAEGAMKYFSIVLDEYLKTK